MVNTKASAAQKSARSNQTGTFTKTAARAESRQLKFYYGLTG